MSCTLEDSILLPPKRQHMYLQTVLKSQSDLLERVSARYPKLSINGAVGVIALVLHACPPCMVLHGDESWGSTCQRAIPYDGRQPEKLVHDSHAVHNSCQEHSARCSLRRLAFLGSFTNLLLGIAIPFLGRTEDSP